MIIHARTLYRIQRVILCPTPRTARPLAPTMANWRCLDASESLFDVARCRDRRLIDGPATSRASLGRAPRHTPAWFIRGRYRESYP